MSLPSARVDLRVVAHLPSVAQRARALLDALAAGRHPLALGGKLLKCCALYSLPIGRSYRLLVDKRSMRPIRLLTHERYNGLTGRGGRGGRLEHATKAECPPTGKVR
ncbi:ParE family toxin-like protein [Burkholderia pyrrocinia]|uniref:ParE family toxin-like protein n=1 Tax=Burkholderia pyrrocinia TaxID=60550 RepID=UPI003D9A41DD